MIVETRFSLRDRVYGVDTRSKRQVAECALCNGAEILHPVEHPDTEITCPACHGRGFQEDGHVQGWRIREGVQTVSYMMSETGCPSGTRWKDERVFGTLAEAERHIAESKDPDDTVIGLIDRSPE